MKVFVLTAIFSLVITCSSWEENTTGIAYPSDEGQSRSLLSLLQAKDGKHVNEDDRMFYIYELEQEYSWRWPVETSDCSRNKYVKSEYGQLSGIGPSISPEDGLFLTWHFSLFSSLYNRFKRSSRRTRDPKKASLFIIPYDLALDGYVDSDTCNNRNPPRCTNNFAPALMTMLQNNKYFRRHKGADHAVLWSLHEHHMLPTKNCNTFIKNFCANCTFTTYFMNHTKADNRYVSVPFPSGYHWQDEVVNIPWDVNNAGSRNIKAVYLGSRRTITQAHTDIRIAMTNMCLKKDGCQWLKVFHSSTDNKIGDLLSSYKKAVFCLCPPGDDPGRKAVFDSIVAGCIPVIFHVSTIYNQVRVGRDLHRHHHHYHHHLHYCHHSSSYTIFLIVGIVIIFSSPPNHHI